MEGWLADIGVEYSSFEESFSNGYLLGSILYRYNFQDDFGQFINSDKYSSHNLAKLQHSLDRLKIKLESQRLVQKEPNYAKNLLNKLFRALHLVALKQAAAPKTKGGTVVSSKEQLIQKRLSKFEEERKRQALKAFEEHKQQTAEIQNKQQAKRREEIDKIKQNKIFMQQWETQGIEKWKKNWKVRKQNAMKDFQATSAKIEDFKRRNLTFFNETFS